MYRQGFQFQEMTMGTCYYPEHWDAALWENDLSRMLKLGIRVIRIAEFAWNLMEPKEGIYQYDFYDRFLDLAEAKGMQVILGTPTATPPAWLTEKYPEVLNVTEDGTVLRHGGRRHYNYNSKIYRRFCSDLVEHMAEHYGKRACVIGWQLDNELNCETDVFYSEADDIAFRQWLQKRYETIEALNEAWGTVFWNQTYTSFAQVHLPRPVVNQSRNPHQHLDYLRFVDASVREFAKLQADIIRRYKKPQDFITTNGLFGHMDNHKMAEESLDIYMYDSYPNFANALGLDPMSSTDLNDRKWTRHLIATRSVCPHFGIMEQQAGAGSWTTRMEGPMPRPGQLELWAMQSVAQGADFISFFRWRTATVGTEIYWHGILDYDNRDNRRFDEIGHFYQRFQKLQPMVGADNVVSFGVLRDYDNQWDSEVDHWHGRLDAQSLPEIFAGAELTHTSYNEVYLRDDTSLEELTRYPVLIYPHPLIMTEDRAYLLEDYVAQGGTLIVGCCCGYKDIQGHCIMMPRPGLISNLTGTDVKEYTFTSPAEEEVYALWNGQRIETPLYNEVLNATSPGVKVLATYGNSYYVEEPALTEHNFVAGRCIHFGSTFDRHTVAMLLEYTGVAEPFRKFIDAPEDLQVVMRQKGEDKWLFLLNYQSHPVTYSLEWQVQDVFRQQPRRAGTYALPAYGTAVYRL